MFLGLLGWCNNALLSEVLGGTFVLSTRALIANSDLHVGYNQRRKTPWAATLLPLQRGEVQTT